MCKHQFFDDDLKVIGWYLIIENRMRDVKVEEHLKVAVRSKLQVSEKGSIVKASDSVYYDTYSSDYLLILEENRSILGFQDSSIILWKSSGLRFHWSASLRILE